MDQQQQTFDISLHMNIDLWNHKIIEFGKHKGCTFETLYQCNPGYCDWILNKTNDTKFDKIIEFKQYVAYLKSKE